MNLRSTFVALLMATSFCASAQNIQLHYDLGHSLCKDLSGRPSVTTTIEMFRPDRWGSTFFFSDMDYFADGVAGAYWEVAREFNIKKNSPWAVHVEYNGGTTSVEHTAIAARFQHALLAGGAYNWLSADHNTSFSLQALYRYTFKGQSRGAFNGFQATAVWGTTFAKGLLSCSGYLDVWYNPNVQGKLITMAEPQLWFNISALKGMEDVHLSIGTEVEVSNNFVIDDLGRQNRFYAIPTAAVKWTF